LARPGVLESATSDLERLSLKVTDRQAA